jgi:hypothetical protein
MSVHSDLLKFEMGYSGQKLTDVLNFENLTDPSDPNLYLKMQRIILQEANDINAEIDSSMVERLVGRFDAPWIRNPQIECEVADYLMHAVDHYRQFCYEGKTEEFQKWSKDIGAASFPYPPENIHLQKIFHMTYPDLSTVCKEYGQVDALYSAMMIAQAEANPSNVQESPESNVGIYTMKRLAQVYTSSRRLFSRTIPLTEDLLITSTKAS